MTSRLAFKNLGDMARRIGMELWRVPESVDIVVSVPQSGGLPAAFLGLQLDRPVVDLGGYIESDGMGMRHALLVDDVCRTGTTMNAARGCMAERLPHVRITTLVIYSQKGGEEVADIVFERVGTELLLEWSLFRSPVMAHACLDMDGILCADATPAQDDDGSRYLDFLANTTRQTVPRGRIHRIVTSRLERYRAETESWLARHDIKYSVLTMLDLPNEAERRRLRIQGSFKGAVYRSDPGAILFVESETWQAREIARAAPGKPVFDYRTRTLIDSNSLKASGLMRQLRNHLVRGGRLAAKRFGMFR